MRKLLLWCSQNSWMKERWPRYRFVQKAVTRFMPGEEAEAALVESRRLQDHGIGTVLTLLGENITEEAEATEVARHYQGVLETVAQRGLDAQISVKLTQLGLDLGMDVALENLDWIVRHAAKQSNVVWIDMEGSAYTDVTLEIFHRLCQAHRNVGLCVQSYLYRTEKDLEWLLPFAPAIRLVKGAYAEPSEIAFPKKKDVDANYLKLSRRLLDENVIGDGVRPAFATHDMKLIQRIQQEAETRGIPRSAYEFQMLYGIRREAQRQLVGDGYRMRVLISYGPSWFPWYMRRLAERPANIGFVLKCLIWP